MQVMWQDVVMVLEIIAALIGFAFLSAILCWLSICFFAVMHEMRKDSEELNSFKNNSDGE